MLNKTTLLKICAITTLSCAASVATAGGMVKDSAGQPVMGIAQPMMAEKMDKMDDMDKKPMMDHKMEGMEKMDTMEQKPMMDHKMKK